VRLKLTLLICFFISVHTFAQKDTIEEGVLINYSEPRPEYPGGDDALYKYIAKNLEYPQQAKDSSIEGRVIIEFTIDTAGYVTNAAIIHKQLTRIEEGAYDFGLGECAINVVTKSPKWHPAKSNGKVISIQMRIPILFKL
jgi:protein TonB